MRVWCVGALMISFFVGNGQSYSGNTWAEVSANKQGTLVFSYVETPALVYKNISGKLSGICVDIMSDFVDYVNQIKSVKLEVTWVGEGADFQGMYDRVRNSTGGVFGLGNITITETRKKEVRFSPPFITNFAVLITHNKVPMITTFNDLPNLFSRLNAYTVRGTINDYRFAEIRQKYFPGIKIIYTASSQETLEKVTSDPNGIAYVDVAFYLHAVRDLRAIKRHPAGDKSAEKFGFSFPQNSDWNSIVAEFFNANGGYIKSARYKAILNRHLGETGVRMLQTAE